MPAEVDSSSTPVPSPHNQENLKCSGTDYAEMSVSRSTVSDTSNGKFVQKVHCNLNLTIPYQKKGKEYKIIHVVRGA